MGPRLRMMVGTAALAATATACPAEPPVDNTAQVNACKIESRTIKTAYAASAGDLDPTMTVFAYLAEYPEYFALEAGPTTGPVPRSSATLAIVAEADCPAVVVPVGSD